MRYKVFNVTQLKELGLWLVFANPTNVFYITEGQGKYSIYRGMQFINLLAPNVSRLEVEFIKDLDKLPVKGDAIEL